MSIAAMRPCRRGCHRSEEAKDSVLRERKYSGWRGWAEAPTAASDAFPLHNPRCPEPEVGEGQAAQAAVADIDNSSTIVYGEFVAATLHLNKVEREDHLFAAFQYFDKDGSGYIKSDELQQACNEFGIEDVQLEDMIGEVDQDNDGRIDYNEFVAMMQKTTTGFAKKDHQYNLSIGFRDALKTNS
ncbi:hypothetical protein ACP4OV_020113 [Aristida adscensionis]